MWLTGRTNLRTNLTVTNYFLFPLVGKCQSAVWDFKGLDPRNPNHDWKLAKNELL